MNTSILYYTNNVLSEPLLKKTLFAAAEHASVEDRELLVSSHFPLTKEYERIVLGDQDFSDTSGIYSHLIKGEWELPCANYRAYVVGKKPYVLRSICEQMLHLLENANGENIVLMEHDCFYPSDYVESVGKALDSTGSEMGYVFNSHTYFNYDGFWKLQGGVSFMSGFSFKKYKAIEILKRKIELDDKETLSYFEPLLSINPQFLHDRYPDEIIYKNHVCIDEYLMEDHDLLDLKHGMNQGGYIMANGGKIDNIHPYWGNAAPYLNLLESMNLSQQEVNRYVYGISMY